MQINERTKKLLSFALRFVLSFALLGYLFTKIDVEKTMGVVKAADPLSLLYALLLFVVIIVIMIGRWMVYVNALKLNAGFLQVMRYYFLGLFWNLFLPSAIGGDIIKTIGLCRNSQQKPKVVASVLLDRLSGFAGMVVVATISFIYGFQLINEPSLIISILMMAAISLIMATILFVEKLYSFCCKIFSRFPRVQKGLMHVHYDIVLLKGQRSAVYKTVGISCFCQLLLAMAWYLIGRALHQDINFIYFIIFIPLICVASSMPSISGLGVREAVTVYLFSKVGVEAGVAMSMSLINYLFMLIVGILGGLIFMATRSPHELESIKKTAACSELAG